MAADWSAMVLDVLGVIAMKLETCEDFIYFSVVCRSWNSVASLIKNEWRAVPTPWLLLAQNNRSNKEENPNCLRKVFNLENKKCYEMTLPETFGAKCWGSAYGWVAMVDRNLNIQLFNPISKARIQFPSLETIPGLKLYDEKVDKTKDDYIDRCLSGFLDYLAVLRVSQGVSREFAIVAIHSEKGVALARPGDQSWTSIFTDEAEHTMINVVGIDDRVVGLCTDDGIVCWNAKEFYRLEFGEKVNYLPIECDNDNDTDDDGRLQHMYLLRLGNELIMVLRNFRLKKKVADEKGEDNNHDIGAYQTISFQLYKLNLKANTWDEFKDMGDVALLLGSNSSMSVSITSVNKCLQGNCIYYTDDYINDSDDDDEEDGEEAELTKEFVGHDMGVYDIKRDQISRFYEGDDILSLICPPTLFIPQL